MYLYSYAHIICSYHMLISYAHTHIICSYIDIKGPCRTELHVAQRTTLDSLHPERWRSWWLIPARSRSSQLEKPTMSPRRYVFVYVNLIVLQSSIISYAILFFTLKLKLLARCHHARGYGDAWVWKYCCWVLWKAWWQVSMGRKLAHFPLLL